LVKGHTLIPRGLLEKFSLKNLSLRIGSLAFYKNPTSLKLRKKAN